MLLPALKILLAPAMALVLSRLMNYLYAAEPEELSFPDAIVRRARFRLPLLCCGCFLACAELSFPLQPADCFTGIFYLFLVVIALMDWEQYIICDKLLLPFAALALLRIFCLRVESPEMLFDLSLPYADYLLAGLAGGGLLLVLAIISGGAIGGGDIKLLAVLGLWFGTGRLVSVLGLGFMLGGAAALFLLLTGQKKRRDYFAYGPYFACAAAFVWATAQ